MNTLVCISSSRLKPPEERGRWTSVWRAERETIATRNISDVKNSPDSSEKGMKYTPQPYNGTPQTPEVNSEL